MTSRTQQYVSAIVIVLCFIACDVISPPYTHNSNNQNGRPDTGMISFRKVLVEEFTGAQCTNCPIGHRKLADLSGVFGDSIVIVSVHAGEFARPNTQKGYPDDFRTQVGEELNSRFRVFAYPAAVINRTKIGGSSYVVGVQNWGSVITEQLRLPTPLAIQIRAVLDTVTRKLTTTVKCRSLSPYNGQLNIGYYILEDSIVAPQLDNGVYIPNYIHRHVLRAAPLGAYGEPLVPSLTFDTTIERNYVFDLPSTQWNKRHLEIVVYIAHPEPDFTIIQCDSKHVTIR